MNGNITTRPTAVAGMFYPAQALDLERQIARYLDVRTQLTDRPKVLIAPHAGYDYSGPIAGSAYAEILPYTGTIERVVLLGPSHRVGFPGLALSSAGRFATPLGDLPVDGDATGSIRHLPGVSELDAAHAMEHSLEVHLPFIKKLLPAASLVPIVVGDADADSVARVLDTLWGGAETLIIISSDLSHFHDYATAKRIDAETTREIEQFNTRLSPEQACGCRPVNGLLQIAAARDLDVRTLDVRNSGDTQGNRDRVVGYGAWGLT